MSIPDDLRDIFEKVRKATEEGRIAWNAGPLPDTMVLTLDDFSFQIERKFRPPTVMHPPSANAPPGVYDYSPQLVLGFKVLDRRGDLVDGFELRMADGDEFKTMESLFETARRSTQDIQGKLSRLKEQLAAKLGA